MSLFKPYLKTTKSNYKGGKSRADVPSGDKLYKLSSNENMLGSSPKAIEAIKNEIDRLNEYPDRTDRRLREALSLYYEGKLSPEQFVAANSGVGILQQIAQVFLGEGLECIFTNPAFKPYTLFASKVGAKSIDIPLSGPQFSLNVPGILEAITDRTRVIWICSPNNPTGTYIPKQDLDLLIQNLPDDVVLIYDEVYWQFATAADYTTAIPYIDQGKNVIAVNSFSKAYGLAGLRVGYAYSTPELAGYLAQGGRPFLINRLAMEGSIAALSDHEFLSQTVALVNGEKPFLYAQLERLGVKFWKSQANFIMIKPDMPAEAFEARMLELGIMVRPVANFGAPGCVRVTIGIPEANRAYIKALEQITNSQEWGKKN